MPRSALVNLSDVSLYIVLTSCMFLAEFFYKIKDETTDDDAPIDLVSVPQKCVYGGGQKNAACIIDLDSKDSDDAYEVLKDEDDESLKKQYPGTDPGYIRLVPLLHC